MFKLPVESVWFVQELMVIFRYGDGFYFEVSNVLKFFQTLLVLLVENSCSVFVA